MHEFVLASSNPGKIKEFNSILEGTHYCVRPQEEWGIESIEETGLSFIENAILKARHASRWSGLPAIADDSGLIVDALGGAPGIYSARYAGEGALMSENIAKLLKEMEPVPTDKRSARFCCVIVSMKTADDPNPLIFQSFWEGEILTAPRGKNGFGYDPIFYVPTHRCSSAELDSVVKNKISHRAQSLTQLREYYEKLD